MPAPVFPEPNRLWIVAKCPAILHMLARVYRVFICDRRRVVSVISLCPDVLLTSRWRTRRRGHTLHSPERLWREPLPVIRSRGFAKPMLSIPDGSFGAAPEGIRPLESLDNQTGPILRIGSCRELFPVGYCRFQVSYILMQICQRVLRPPVIWRDLRDSIPIQDR